MQPERTEYGPLPPLPPSPRQMAANFLVQLLRDNSLLAHDPVRSKDRRSWQILLEGLGPSNANVGVDVFGVNYFRVVFGNPPDVHVFLTAEECCGYCWAMWIAKDPLLASRIPEKATRNKP